VDCCAPTHGPELGLLLRLFRGVAAMIYRAVTLPYADTVASAIFILTFLWVLIVQRGTPISTGETAETTIVKRAA
jgi:hypothetical protein